MTITAPATAPAHEHVNPTSGRGRVIVGLYDDLASLAALPRTRSWPNLPKPTVTITVEVLQGVSAAVLHDTARDAALLVLGARNHRRSDCSVEIQACTSTADQQLAPPRAANAQPTAPVSLARFSSRFSRSKSLIRDASPMVTPGRRPLSMSARFTHPRSVSGFTPTRGPIRNTAAFIDNPGSCSRASATNRCARSRNSGGNFPGRFRLDEPNR